MYVGSEDRGANGSRGTRVMAGDCGPRGGRSTEGSCRAGYVLRGVRDSLVEAPESEIDLRHTPLQNLD